MRCVEVWLTAGLRPMRDHKSVLAYWHRHFKGSGAIGGHRQYVTAPGMGFFAWYASASSATATQFKILRAVPKFCVHSKGEVLSADLFYGVS